MTREGELILIQNSSDVEVAAAFCKALGFWTMQILYSHDCMWMDSRFATTRVGEAEHRRCRHDSSRKVLVEHGDIDVNDDALCLKAGATQTVCA